MSPAIRKANGWATAHADLMTYGEWISDGYGDTETAWERFEKADALIHIDLPLVTHYWWVTRRLVMAPYSPPEGWRKTARYGRAH